MIDSAPGVEPASNPAGAILDIHRIGGGTVDNLRLKPREARLSMPGISVIRCDTPEEAAQQMRTTFPHASGLNAAATTIGSTSGGLIRAAGFDIIHVPSASLPNHYRIVHPSGVAGFTDENLARLEAAFVNSTGH
jgi:hypothetical protein